MSGRLTAVASRPLDAYEEVLPYLAANRDWATISDVTSTTAIHATLR